MNSIKQHSRLWKTNALAVASIVFATCCWIPNIQSAEKTATRNNFVSTTSNSKLQWQPVRKNSPESHPVRTVQYEQDVFDDGPALQRKATLAVAPLDINPNQPSQDLPPPSQTDQPPATLPNNQPPATTAPTEAAPSESLPPLEFRPPTTREPSITPTPTPAERPETPPDSLNRTPMPETTLPPDTFQPLRPSPLHGFNVTPRDRSPINSAEDCEAAYNKLKANTINKLSIDIKVTGQPGDDVPYECTLSDDLFDPRCWKLTTYTWKASALCHKPIYFEEVALERYGHSHGPGCEYLVSFAHFFGNVALLPYHMGIETPCECVYTLGYYRPGSCAPYILDPFPVSLRGAAVGAAGYCGVIALFP